MEYCDYTNNWKTMNRNENLHIRMLKVALSYCVSMIITSWLATIPQPPNFIPTLGHLSWALSPLTQEFASGICYCIQAKERIPITEHICKPRLKDTNKPGLWPIFCFAISFPAFLFIILFLFYLSIFSSRHLSTPIL